MPVDVVEISPITSRQSQLLVFLACLLKLSADNKDAGFVLAAPFVMKASEELVLMPDLLFVGHENQDQIKQDHLDGPADIAVEVVAFGSNPDEREDNIADYEASGVREYWLIDYEYSVAKFYQRNAQKTLVPARVGESGIYRSKVLPDLWLKVSWFWETPPPKALVIMREWRII